MIYYFQSNSTLTYYNSITIVRFEDQASLTYVANHCFKQHAAFQKGYKAESIWALKLYVAIQDFTAISGKQIFAII